MCLFACHGSLSGVSQLADSQAWSLGSGTPVLPYITLTGEAGERPDSRQQPALACLPMKQELNIIAPPQTNTDVGVFYQSVQDSLSVWAFSYTTVHVVL